MTVFGRLGPVELILILAIVLVIFGPSKLPAVGESLGKAIRGFRDHTERESDEESGEDKSQ